MMRIVVTGAGGFIGRQLVRRLADRTVVAIDYEASRIPDLPHVIPLAGDLCDTRILSAATAEGCDAVVHLATVPGGAAEQDPELARRVNIEATMALAATAALSRSAPRFVFASSIAVLGDRLPAVVDDDTPLSPAMLYGAHKTMMEQWLATLTRRGELDAVSLRLSGVVARPRGPSGLKSAYLSDVFHALRAGEPFVVPVSPEATTWVTSIDCAVFNLVHALSANLTSMPASRAVTLPALRVRMTDLVEEIATQSGVLADSVSYQPDQQLEAGFGAYPLLQTPAAEALGFVHDGDIESLVRSALRKSGDVG